ncbi:hypothetical protein ACQ4LE_004890 [Meloidogyne hapla]|uniref:Receptor expression-enhancing protein n=1 Tax=Meloidogyne hapla TaxID=6305 RepID=A0A1I8B2L7_MELHA
MSVEDQMANPLAVGTLDEQLAIAKEHIEALVTDHRHFTARWLTKIKENAGLTIDEWALAKILVNLFGLWLTISERADFVANALLAGVPLILTFFYPEEKATNEDMLIYWPCYAVITLFDFILRAIPCWYMLKIVFFALFFLRPWRLALKIRLLMLLLEMSRQTALAQQSQSTHQKASSSSSSHRSAVTRPQQNQQQMSPELIAQLLTALNASNRSANATEGGTTTNSLPTPEQLAALQRAMAEGGGKEGQQQGSTYFDLRAKSKTKLVNPVPSRYADVKEKDENKK